MMTKQQIAERIERLGAELSELKLQLDKTEDVPETLRFENGELFWGVNVPGGVVPERYSCCYAATAKEHRAFKSREMAELFRQKTQFIADALFWKELYDRDFVPDWKNQGQQKWFVIFDWCDNWYSVDYTFVSERAAIHFSTREIAQRFADWLNERKANEPVSDEVPF